MKTRKHVGLVLLILTINSVWISARDAANGMTMSFDQALVLVQNNSHVIKQSQMQMNEKDEAVKAAHGLYLPKVGIMAGYMKMSQDLTLDLTPVKEAITPLYSTLAKYGTFSSVPNPDPATQSVLPILTNDLSTQAVRGKLSQGLTQLEEANWNQMIQKKQFATVMATAQWPIFTGGKIHAANNVAQIERNEANEVIRQKEGEQISELVERYFGLCLAIQAVKVRQDVFDGMQKHLSDAEKMQKDGLIANAEVLQARLYNAQADRELKKARRNVNVINEALVNTLALENDTVITPLSELFYVDSVESVQYFISQAIEKNPLLLQVEGKKHLTEQNYKVQIAEFMPVIALQGSYDVWNKDLSPYAPDWIIGVGLHWTIFDGTTRYHKVRAASYKKSQVLEAKEKAYADVETAINKLHNELNMYREQLSQLQAALDFANEYLRIREKAFHEQMSNATEVVDARLALAQVRMERLQAMYGFDVTLSRLLQYAGTPEEFNIYRQRPTARTESYQAINR